MGVEGRPSRELHRHEHGHIMANVAEGLNPFAFVTDTHPDAIENGAAAQVHTDVSGAEEGPKGIAQRVIGILGGPAFDDVHQNTPLHRNSGARGDIARAREILREEGGLRGNQLDKVFDALYERAKEHVSNPEALGLVEANADLRESGIHPSVHMTAGRMESYVKLLKGAYRNGETPSTEGVREGDSDGTVSEGKPADAGNVGSEQDGAVEGTRAESPQETREEPSDGRGVSEKSNLKPGVPPERTTGNEDVDNAIRTGGGIPGGTMKGFEYEDNGKKVQYPDTHLFHDPTSGTTLAVKADEDITPQNIQSKLEQSRAAYAAAEAKKTEKSNIQGPTTQKLIDKYGTTDELKDASFITPDGQHIPTPEEHADALSGVGHNFGESTWDNVNKYINSENAVRMRNLGHGDVNFTIPEKGVSEEQAAQIRRVVGNARNPNLIIEKADGKDTSDGKIRARVSDVQPILDKLKGVEKSNLSAKKAKDITDKIVAKYGTSDNVEPLRREHSFILPDGKLVHLEGSQHGDAIAEAGGPKSSEKNNWDNRPEFLNASGLVRAHGFQNRGGDNLSFSVPKNGVTPEQAETINRAASQGFLRNGTLNMERTDVTHENRNELSKQKDFPRAGDAMQMLREIGAHPTEKSSLTKDEKNGGMEEVPNGLTREELDNAYDAFSQKKIGKATLTGLANSEPEDVAIWHAVQNHPNGGFSVDPRTGKTPTDGYMVETKKIDQTFDHPPTDVDYRKFLDAHQQELSDDPTLQMGGWINPDGKYTVALTSHIPDRATAVDLGQKHNQISIYDLAKGEEIPTGGTGEAPVEKSNLVKGSSVPLMKKPLDVEGTGEKGKISTLDIAKALNEFSQSKHPALELGEAEPEAMVARAKKIALDEAKYQLAQGKTGTEWYTEEMKDHDQALNGMRPELESGEKIDTPTPWPHTAKQSLFKAAEAITSAGQKPYGNFKSAVKGWDHYNETGQFSPWNPNSEVTVNAADAVPVAKTAANMKKEGRTNFEVGDRISVPGGGDQAIVKVDGDNLLTAKSWGPRGVAAYGDALENLNRLVSEKGEKGAADWLLSDHPVSELKEYNPGVKGKKDDMLPGAMILGAKRGPFFQNLHGIESAFTADMWVSRTWNRWMGTTEVGPDREGNLEIKTNAPRNETERGLMKKSFSETANDLNLSTSSLQAVLWYYEQALYGAQGVPKESWSFRDAAQRAAKEEKEAPGQDQFAFGENEGKQAEPRKTKFAGAIHALDFIDALKGKK
jgi:hypothetical protein